MPARQEHVVRLDVAVYDALAMSVGERVGDFGEELHRFVNRQLPLARESAAKVVAIHERHDVVEEPVGFSRVVQWKDVRMLQLGGDLDLTEESVGPEGGGKLGAQDLERHLAAVLEILGQVDRRHSALSQLTVEPVSVDESGAQSFQNVSHDPSTVLPRMSP